MTDSVPSTEVSSIGATVMVALLNEEHEPLLAFNFARAYPVKWTVSDFKAQDNAIVVESLELSYDFFQRV